jgi:cytochrome c biogenesis factor
VTEIAVGQGESARIGPYDIQIGKLLVEPVRPGQVYDSQRAPVTVFRDGEEVAALLPEKRFYPKTGHRMESQITTEVEIARLKGEDFYVYYDHKRDDGKLTFTIFRSPCMWLVWIGWITMIVGGGFAALPLGGRKVGLA